MSYKKPFCHHMTKEERKTYKKEIMLYNEEEYIQLVDNDSLWQQPTDKDIEFINQFNYDAILKDPQKTGMHFGIFMIILGIILLISGIINVNLSYIITSLMSFIFFGFLIKYYNKNYKSLDKVINAFKNNEFKVIHGTVSDMCSITTGGGKYTTYIDYCVLIDLPNGMHRKIVIRK